MTPALTALLGFLVGAVGGVLATHLIWRSRPVPAVPDRLPEQQRVLDALRSAAAIVGERDDVLARNAAADSTGLIRGDRVAVPALLDLVRQVRVSGETVAVNLDQTRAGRAEQRLAVRVLRLDDGNILVVAEDRVAALRVQASARGFMANATHELKTPVGAIALLAEAAEQASDDPDAVEHFARKIQAESGRLTQLVGQIVQLSRLQGQPAPLLDTVDVDELIALALDRSRGLAEQRGISLTTGGEWGLAVRGNRDQLLTALTNLVHNAITYSDAKARVVVSRRSVVDSQGDRVAIAVSDNGIGIGPEDQERIFERFYRVDFARSRQTGGTGLGLSIDSEIAEGHGGDVTLWSKLGSGSTFTMVLPVAPEHEEGAE